MQITDKEHKGLSHSFHVIVSAADVASQMDVELQSLGAKVKMPGFRPGKVPMNVLRQKYGRDVMGDVLQSSINKATGEVVKQKKLRPAMQPDIKITSFDEGGDLAFDITVEVLPEVGPIDFEKITVDELTYDIPDSEVAEGVSRLAQSRKHTHKKDGAAEQGNVVKMNFLGKRDDVPFEGGAGSGFFLELGSNQFIPGFEEQLVGVSAGDARVVKVTFPEQYHSADLAGAEATFDVEVLEVHRNHVPEIDDALAESLGFQDLENLKGAVKQQIDFEYKNAARAKAKKQLFDTLDAVIDYEIPQNMLKHEFDSIMGQVTEAQKSGDPELKGKTEDQLKEEYTAIAQRRVRLGILLSDIARQNNLIITREELSAAVMGQARQYPGQEDKVFEFYRKNPAQVDELKGPILEEKAVDFILGKVKRSEKKVTTEQLFADDDTASAKPAKKAKK